MRAVEIFKTFYDSEQDEVRKVRQGTSQGEVSVVARASWDRLSIADRTMLNIFFNAMEGRKDKTSMLGKEMLDYIAGHSAANLVANPDILVCLKLFLGDSE
jgi:hypothetical protein